MNEFILEISEHHQNLLTKLSSIFSDKPKSWIIFKPEMVEVLHNDEQIFFEYSDIEEMAFYFNEEQDYTSLGENVIIESSSISTGSKITFTVMKRKYEYIFNIRKSEFIEMCEFLYRYKIKFKEYYNGSRVFLCKQPSYKDVQIIKKEYGIEW